MIESSRYVTNQIMLTEMGSAHPNRKNVEEMQDEVRTWLLKRMAQIAKNDFAEYNARPYQRYSLAALRNLYDFALDENITVAARNLLDLSAIKFAIGSNQGRRLVPFRRKMEVTREYIHPDLIPGEVLNTHFNGLFDFSSGSDSMIAIMQLYTGDTRQTFANKISKAGTKEMMLAAASGYNPPDYVLDLAIQKPKAYFQRIRHYAAELYFSAPGYIIIGGGVTAGPTSTFELGGASVRGAAGPIQLYNTDDLGAAVPTTIMFETKSRNESSLEAFVRIEGSLNKISDKYWTWDNNLCVYNSFACGTNIVIPIENSCVQRIDEPPWLFIKLNSCSTEIGFSPQPNYFLTAYRVPCGVADPNCSASNTGFVEVVRTDDDVQLEDFASRAKLRVVVPFQQTMSGQRTTLKGRYKLHSGEEIDFDTRANELDPQRTGIEVIDGTRISNLDDWARAEGPLSAAAGSSKFTFRSPIDGRGLDIDMDHWDAPKRVEIQP